MILWYTRDKPSCYLRSSFRLESRSYDHITSGYGLTYHGYCGYGLTYHGYCGYEKPIVCWVWDVGSNAIMGVIFVVEWYCLRVWVCWKLFQSWVRQLLGMAWCEKPLVCWGFMIRASLRSEKDRKKYRFFSEICWEIRPFFGDWGKALIMMISEEVRLMTSMITTMVLSLCSFIDHLDRPKNA